MDKTQLIVWIVIVVGAIGKWLYENTNLLQGGGSDDALDTKPSRTNAPRSLQPGAESYPRIESEEEKMRRFMEALGLPPGSTPPVMRKPAPNPVMKRPAAPAERSVFTPKPQPHVRKKIAPPLDTGGPIPVLPKMASMAETAPSMEVASIPQMTFARQAAVASAVEAVSAPKPRPVSSTLQKPESVGIAGVLREQLRDPASLRRAVLMKEILGAPKGLQSAESLSIFSPL